MNLSERAEFIIATSLHARARGLLGNAAKNIDKVLILVPCRSIHTIGMHFAIDVAFIDRSGTVVRAERSIQPNKLLCCRKAYFTAERPSCDNPWPTTGEKLPIRFR